MATLATDPVLAERLFGIAVQCSVVSDLAGVAGQATRMDWAVPPHGGVEFVTGGRRPLRLGVPGDGNLPEPAVAECEEAVAGCSGAYDEVEPIFGDVARFVAHEHSAVIFDAELDLRSGVKERPGGTLPAGLVLWAMAVFS